MNYLIVHLCQPHLIINYNATQYKVGYDDQKQNKKVSSILPESESRTHKKARKVTEKNGITGCFIKSIYMIVAL